MATSKTPIRTVYDNSNSPIGLAEFQTGEVVPVIHGGTGANTVAEAKLNLSLTDSNIRSLISVSGGGSYNNSTGVITINSTNLTPYATITHVTNEISNVVGAAPGVLDTLNELAAAINDDANFYTTINNSIGASRNQANAAYDRANVAVTYAGSAFDKANTLITADGIKTLSNTTIDVSTSSNNILRIQGNQVSSYTGYGSSVVLSQSPTISVLNISDSQINLDGGTGIYYWGGQSGVAQAGDLKAGVYASDPSSNNSLFTFGTNGSNYMSVGVEGSLFVGTAMPSNNGGLNTSYPGWLVVQSGGKFGGDIDTLGGINLTDPTNGDITFPDNTVQNTAFRTSVLTTANVAEVTNLYFTNTRARAAITSGNTILYDASTGNITLSVSGVAASTYGGASKVPVLTIDQYGRITSAANVNVAGVTNFAASGNTFTISTADGGSFSASIPDGVDIVSPDLLGTPTAPTASAGTNTTQIATTAFVRTEVANLVDSAPTALDTLNELAAALGDDANFATTTATSIGSARNQANAAYDRANVAVTYAGSAFDKANTLVATVAGVSSTSISNSQLLSGILTVDGSGSNLDADLLDGQNGSYYLDWTNVTNKPDPVITLGGDLSGSVTLTDLASGTLTATIVANSVALGTDTTGDYVQNVIPGTGIVITGTPGESRDATITLSTSGVTAATYGGAGTQIPTLAIDTYGRVTSAANVAINTIKLSAFAATTSAELLGVISDETGSGSLVFANSPTLITPNLGTPSSVVLTNATGTASNLTANIANFINVSDDTTTNATRYPIFANGTSGVIAENVSSTKLTFNPSSGLLTSTDYNSSSDKRLKKEVKTIQSALDKVIDLRGVSFVWKEGNQKSFGLIAQEVEKVLPEVVSTDESGYLGIRYNNIIGILVEAVKEQQKQIDELKSKL